MARFWSVLRRAHHQPSQTTNSDAANAYAACLDEIEALIEAECALARDILHVRSSGTALSQEEHLMLRQLHRDGMRLRARCQDPALAMELGWLQAITIQVAMIDRDELHPSAVERALDQRATQVHDTITLRRRQLQGTR